MDKSVVKFGFFTGIQIKRGLKMARVLMWEGLNSAGRKVRGVLALTDNQDEISARRELVCSKGNGTTPVRVRRIILKELPDMPTKGPGDSEGTKNE